VPFHIEIRSGYQHARAFNLEADDLRERILVPYLNERRIELGDQVWRPEDSKLTILEGPHLEGPDLAFGGGWGNALRRSNDVTEGAFATVRTSLGGEGTFAPPPAPASQDVAVLAAPTPAAADAARRLVTELGVETLDWAAARARLLARSAVVGAATADPGVGAVIVVLDGAPGPELALDVGLALGALGGRAIVTAVGGVAELAALLPGLAVLDLAAGSAAVAERVRLAVG